MELNWISFKWLCNLNQVNMLHFNYTSEAYHTHFYFEPKWSHNGNYNMINLEFICGVWICKFKLQIPHLNWNTFHIRSHTLSFNLQPCDCALYLYWSLCLHCLLSNRRATGIRGHPLRWRPRYRNLVSKASSPPFDHVDKNPFPSLSLMHD